jgi:hypothetical protein
MTREEIEQKMNELAREYHDTHDPEIPEQIFELASRLREMEHGLGLAHHLFSQICLKIEQILCTSFGTVAG